MPFQTMQQSDQAFGFPKFKGSKAVMVVKGPNVSRTALPFLRPEKESLNMLSLLGKLVG
jgi:hypothetical protein